MEVKYGDELRHELAGAGGWGPPFECDPTAVLEDVLDEKISREHARSAYGVVLGDGVAVLAPGLAITCGGASIAKPLTSLNSPPCTQLALLVTRSEYASAYSADQAWFGIG